MCRADQKGCVGVDGGADDDAAKLVVRIAKRESSSEGGIRA